MQIGADGNCLQAQRPRSSAVRRLGGQLQHGLDSSPVPATSISSSTTNSDCSIKSTMGSNTCPYRLSVSWSFLVMVWGENRPQPSTMDGTPSFASMHT
ncbi:MAG TPA: hypothetical protein VKW78_22730 [Terriglobales bacterium]|nr:hypothetical protein [Terriglobales bacterium]